MLRLGRLRPLVDFAMSQATAHCPAPATPAARATRPWRSDLDSRLGCLVGRPISFQEVFCALSPGFRFSPAFPRGAGGRSVLLFKRVCHLLELSEAVTEKTLRSNLAHHVQTSSHNQQVAAFRGAHRMHVVETR